MDGWIDHPNPNPNQEGPLRMQSPVAWPGVFEPSEPLRLPAAHPEAARLVAGFFGGEKESE